MWRDIYIASYYSSLRSSETDSYPLSINLLKVMLNSKIHNYNEDDEENENEENGNENE